MSHDLERYLRKMNVSARFFRLEEHTMTVDAAASRLDVGRERIVKSILFIDDSSQPVMAIVTGDRRVSEKKLTEACGKRVRRASPIEVKRYTGYDVGAVPPLGYSQKIRTFVDEKVMTFDRIIGGGGETNSLLEIDPAEIRRLAKGEIRDIAE